MLGERAGLREPITLHNFYVPAGGDIPDPAVNAKFAHKLAFLDEMHGSATLRPARSRAQHHRRRPQRGAARMRRVEPQAALTVVSHTPIECEKLLGVQKAGGWIDAVRSFVPEPTKLFTWWSYRSPDWAAADRGRRLDHIWVSPALADRVSAVKVFKDSRGWTRPSDHVPVTATLEL